MTITYRLRQGLRALFAFSQPLDLDLAAHYLSPRLLEVFRHLNRGEQLHSLNVLRTVLAQGSTPADLAAAALLHDVGKSRWSLSVAQKTWAVIVHRLAPSLFERWSRGSESSFWHRPFVVYAHHPAWGAQLVAQAGASESLIWLIAHHADSPHRWSTHPCVDWLRRLQQADDLN